MWSRRNIRWKDVSCFLLLTFAGFPALAADNCQDALPSKLQDDITLPAGCVFDRPIRITDSNTFLNCNGSTFDGKGTEKIGLTIDSRGKPLKNIRVENCVFRNFESNGIRITWAGKDAKKGENHEEIYANSPTNIVIEKVTIIDSGNVGIYIDDYVTDVVVQNSVIQRTTGVGIYLEHSSKRNKIVSNRLLGNGYRLDKVPREAIAVDSSAENVIEGNTFKDNAAGGIFLYKNCSERISSGVQAIRWQPSNDNIIRNNLFIGEKVGIWVASRQSRNLEKWDCGDRPMDDSRKYYEDFADSNKVVGNTFCRTAVPIRNEGDNNSFVANKFDASVKTRVHQPVSMRQKLLARPTRGTTIQNNIAIDCSEVAKDR